MIVANSKSLTEGVAPLEFADAQSQRLYPAVAKVALAPKRDAVLRGLAEIFK